MPSLFDPHVISRIEGMTLRSRRLVEGYMTGMHRSRLRGMSTEFAQHRPYAQGDDPRHLDWKAFAKSDRYYIKEHESETNLRCMFCLDSSHSMFFKSREAAMSKFEYAATVVASLSYLLMTQKDAFGLVLFDDKVRAAWPCRSSGGHFLNVVDVLEGAEPGGQTNLARALAAVAPQMRRKGLVVVVSDFVDDPESFNLSLARLIYAGHDVVLFHVEDPVERDFPFGGQTIFLGLEGEGKLLCEAADLREAYLGERRAHVEALRDMGRRMAFDVEEMSTDEGLDAALSGFFAYRNRRQRL
jgi:uncharacterized protein (DUF58 family)